MRQAYLARSLFAVLFLILISAPVLAAVSDDKEDTDTRMVNAKVVEVNDEHISVIARTGVEHVISVDRAGTKVILAGREVSLKELREGDIVTVMLDEQKPVKFAKNISIKVGQTEVARNRR